MGPHTELSLSQTSRGSETWLQNPWWKTDRRLEVGSNMPKDVNVLSLTGAGPSNDLTSALYPSY